MAKYIVKQSGPLRGCLLYTSINPVTMAERIHLFPSRTQKLSSHAPIILGGKLPGNEMCIRDSLRADNFDTVVHH